MAESKLLITRRDRGKISCPEAERCAREKLCCPPGRFCALRNLEPWQPSVRSPSRSFPGPGFPFFAPATKLSTLHQNLRRDKFAMAMVLCCRPRLLARGPFLPIWESLATGWKNFAIESKKA